MATSRNCSEYDRDSADSDTDSVISTTSTKYGYSSLRNATQRFITHPDITASELVRLLSEPSKLPVEMRARKIPLEHLLQRDNIANDVFICLIRILTSLCNTGGDDAWNVIRFFAGEGFISIHVLLYIIQLRVQSVHDKNAVHTSYKTMKQIITLLKSFVQVNSSTEEAAKSVAAVMKDIVGASAENDTKSQELLQDVLTINEPTQVAGAADLTKSDAAAPTKSFRDVGILPSPGEVVDSKPPNFSDLKIDGSSRLETYLGTHFQLLRQEIVEPLRASISVFHQKKRSMNVEDIVRSQECCILYDAQIKGIVTSHTSKGVAFRVQFSYGFPISWEKTNILAFGNLVCLTTNDFHDMIFGVVAKRDPKFLQRGSVELRTLRAEDASKLLPNQHFLMLDSRIYVEEYYEVLSALRQIKEDGSNMAFVDHIVSLSSAINPPNFLQQDPNIMHDIGPLFKREATTQALKQRQTVKVANANDWPLPTQCNVDDYQMRALFAALNREVTVITGSPGTGKTYMCQKIAHLKLINKLRDQGPILFISSTRATLDEFLLGILEFQSTGIVRSGGKTFSTELTQYGLEAYREPYKEKLLESDRAHEAELRECGKRIDSILMNVTFFDKAILSVDVLGVVIAREHLNGFNKRKGAMLEWLLQGKITPRELEWILGQIPTVPSPGGYDRRQSDGRWLERKLLLDYHPDATKALPGLHEMVRRVNAFRRMQEASMHNVTDIWQLPLEDRWRLYRFWVSELYITAQSKLEKVYQLDMDAIVKRSQRIHDETDLSILQSASVIGMTTSAAVKVHRVLKRLKASIVLVDESADILQPITAAVLPPGSEQLVLMGECLPKLNQHQTVKKLTENSSVKASLIQRLNEHDYSVHTLGMQHRMSPEVSKIARNLSLIDDFKHSPLVTGCSENFGVAHNVFFIEHAEEVSPAKHESSFLWALCNYLLSKGCREDQITVLTTFPAQFWLFRGKLDEQLQSVQNFRGGNDVVLFMANGSERKSRPGCIESDMGLITVLTCSRKALFVIGNFNFLGSKSEVWARVIAEARRLDLVDKGLKVLCPQHPGKPKVVTTCTEFLNHQRNGCGLPCESRLDCGHTCKLPCHEHNPDDRVTCKAECGRTICTNGHKCKRLCHQRCVTVCRELTEKELPCGHLKKIACNLPPSGAVCRDRCEKLLPCKHPCANECSMPCTTRCEEKTTKTDWDCGHRVNVRCSDGPESCPQPCTSVLSCDHACSGTCGKCRRGRLHAVCSQPCGRTLVCGHVCESSCSNECPPCGKKCENRCQHSICTRKCGEPCIPCREDCLWRCRHVRCPKQCGEPCDRKTCDRPCEIILPCRHPCIGLCGEKCPTKCRVCNEDEVTEIFFGTEDEESARLEMQSNLFFYTCTPSSPFKIQSVISIIPG